MKKLKTILSIGLVVCALTACDFEKRCYCLETSDNLEYSSDKCYQASRSNIVESVYIINPPSNPDDDPSSYKFDLSWNDVIVLDHFKFVDGLLGKQVNSIFKVNDQILKVTFDGDLRDSEATSGYLRVSPSAFRGLTERAIDAFLYAYIAIGDDHSYISK